MKKFKLALHTKILLGLVLGAIFGSVFHMNPNEIEITANSGKEKITDWTEAKFFIGDSLVKSFEPNSQLAIIKYPKTVTDKKLKEKLNLKTKFGDGSEKVFTGVIEITKVKSLGAVIRPAGDIFIRLLSMIAVPLVFASLIVGAASLSDLKHVARVGGKTVMIFMFTSVLSITMGLVMANVMQPGHFMPPETKDMLLQTYSDEASAKIEQNVSVNIVDFFVNIVPRNPFKAIADGDFLQVVFFAILTGIFLTQVPKDKSQTVINFFEGLSSAMILLVEKVMYIAPYAVFALISATVAEFGVSILQTLLMYSLTVLFGLLMMLIVVYPALLKTIARQKVFPFYKALRHVMVVAFSTSSSAATLPLEIEVAEKRLGVPNKIASFVLPLGATINMDGTALYQAVAAMFIAQVYGIEMDLVKQITIVITAVLASIGTAPVPGVGLIMLIIVLRSVGIPEEGIALILGVDRLLDMARTVPNIISDSFTAVTVAKSEGELGEMKPDLEF
ncbi:MAG: dicarboxylate/amino acid:cation symporter [Ignavibacteria bacterium]|jgi:Na+/H+-dicarboxylate symporter|nr:dicarboxylate/amino acid:cation symporter [Ignavibacteria bacterium]